MAAAKPSTQAGFAPVLAALATMQSNANRGEKSQAHEFLEQFQKSPEAWTTTHAILQNSDSPVEARLFAATTLKGKVSLKVLLSPSLHVLQGVIDHLRPPPIARDRLGPIARLSDITSPDLQQRTETHTHSDLRLPGKSSHSNA